MTWSTWRQIESRAATAGRLDEAKVAEYSALYKRSIVMQDLLNDDECPTCGNQSLYRDDVRGALHCDSCGYFLATNLPARQKTA
jgi:predicted RNA-binding Zn-ribbon protein involved in translation (DUF1610 family)